MVNFKSYSYIKATDATYLDFFFFGNIPKYCSSLCWSLKTVNKYSRSDISLLLLKICRLTQNSLPF